MPDEIVQGELIIAALLRRTHNGRKVILSDNELDNAYRELVAGELDITRDELGNTIIELKEAALHGVVIEDKPLAIE